MTQRNLFYVTAFLLLFVGLRYNSFTAPLERDEGGYAYSAWIMRNGEFPYEKSFLQKPPMIIYTYVLGQLINENSVWPPRLLGAIFTLGSTVLLAQIAGELFGKRYRWPVVFVFTPMIMLPVLTPYSANTEVFMLTPLLGLVYLYVSARPIASMKRFFLAGVLSVTALLYKPICIFVIGFIYIIWFVELVRRNEAFGLRLVAVCLGGGLTALFILGPFLVNDGGVYLWEQAVVFTGYYARSWGFGLEALIDQVSRIIKFSWPLFIAGVLYFVFLPKRWWFSILLILGSVMAIFSSPIGHYYLLAIPFVALVVGYSVVRLAEEGWIKERGIGTGVVLAIYVLMAGFVYREQFGKTPEEMTLWIYGTQNPFYEAGLVAEKLGEVTETNEKVFVAGLEPEILFYAKRRSVSKYVDVNPLKMKTPKVLDYQREAIGELAANPPAAIVLSQMRIGGIWEEGSPREFVDYLDRLIKDEYRLVGGHVWINGKSYWLEEMTEAEKRVASLLLYKRKV